MYCHDFDALLKKMILSFSRISAFDIVLDTIYKVANIKCNYIHLLYRHFQIFFSTFIRLLHHYTNVRYNSLHVSQTNTIPDDVVHPVGGGRSHIFTAKDILPSMLNADSTIDYTTSSFSFVDHVDNTGLVSYPIEQGFIYATLSLSDLIPYIPVSKILSIA